MQPCRKDTVRRGGGQGKPVKNAATCSADVTVLRISSALTGIRDNPVQSAGVAVHPQETSGQNAAIKKRTQFPLHEPGHKTAAIPLPGQEGLDMTGQNAVEDALFRQALRRLHTKVCLSEKPSAFISGGIPLGIVTYLSFVGS